jgi:hypothetical protein
VPAGMGARRCLGKLERRREFSRGRILPGAQKQKSQSFALRLLRLFLVLQLFYMKLLRAHPILFALLFFFPVLTYAQVSGLVPCGNAQFTNYFDPAYYLNATGCNFCYLAKLIQAVVNFLIMVTIPISVGMFAWAGILFFTSAGNPKRISRARSIFSAVFWGFVIALSGWLLVQVVLQAITRSDFYSANNWVNLDCNNPDIQRNRPRDINIGSVINGNSLVSTAPGTGTGGGTTGGTTGGGSADLSAVQNAINSQALQSACAQSSAVDCSLLQAICAVESGCGQNVGGPSGCNTAGACGPMQILPETACSTNSSISGCNGSKVGNLSAVQAALQNSAISATLATQILTANSSACGGDLDCTIAAYHGGIGATAPSINCPGQQKWQCQYDTNSRTTGQPCSNTTNDCVPNTGYQATRSYVPNVKATQGVIRLISAPSGPGSTSGGPF